METVSRSTVADERAAPILVATDGTQQSDGALAVARALAASLGTTAQVLAVQPRLNLIVPDTSLVLDSSAMTRLNVELDQRVRKQCSDISAKGSGPALTDPDMESGDPERVICRVADD